MNRLSRLQPKPANPSVRGTWAAPANSACQTRIAGIPAILLEVVGPDDPIEAGKNATYEISITNQGSAPATNAKVVCQLEPAQQFVSTDGIQAANQQGNTIELTPIPVINPKAKAALRVTVKALKAANVRFKAILTSDQLDRPVEETESTNQH
ncbi:MAG: hypothetical protein J7M29_12110 [Verrucomicrobia bacterium]|nr:hypothetical protein [Verrucomicrobiota bacterium]